MGKSLLENLNSNNTLSVNIIKLCFPKKFSGKKCRMTLIGKETDTFLLKTSHFRESVDSLKA